MTPIEFSEDQSDALQEVTNIAMGRAASALGTALDAFVCLEVPNIRIIESRAVAGHVARMADLEGEVTAIRQAFYGTLSGEVIVLHSRANVNEIFDLLGYEGDSSDTEEQELLLDVSNMLVGACMNQLGKLLTAEVGFSPPSILADRKGLSNVLDQHETDCDYALLIQIRFRLEERDFYSHLLIFVPEQSITLIQSAVDDFLEEMGL